MSVSMMLRHFLLRLQNEPLLTGACYFCLAFPRIIDNPFEPSAQIPRRKLCWLLLNKIALLQPRRSCVSCWHHSARSLLSWHHTWWPKTLSCNARSSTWPRFLCILWSSHASTLSTLSGRCCKRVSARCSSTTNATLALPLSAIGSSRTLSSVCSFLCCGALVSVCVWFSHVFFSRVCSQHVICRWFVAIQGS